MAGIAAARRGLSVLIAEKMDRPCRKLLITGKGRCNLANRCDTDTFIRNIRRGGQFMYSSCCGFDSAAVMQFFEEAGVPLKTERGNRVYPCSDRAKDIADALVGQARAAGCVMARMAVSEILHDEASVLGVAAADRVILARAVVVATGGLSYPGTGSTGDGYRFARQAGHTVTDTAPALVPLVCAGGDCAALQGLSLRNVRLTARIGKKTVFDEQGEMLFTHFGISGPLVLSMSSCLVGADWARVAVAVDLKPALDPAELDRRILRDFSENTNREFKNVLEGLLPRKMISVVVARSGICPHQKIHAVTAGQRMALVEVLKRFSLTVTGARPIAEAVVTAGGVSLREVDPKTMMSKRLAHLHFAGEVLDADGFTGGFNLGIAFATGYAAGNHILRRENT
jgi:predicted Rossmann fold flavoprotein